MSICLARSYRCCLEAFASTPPADGRDVSRPPLDCSSDGPLAPLFLGSQWSPTFSWVCLRAPYATRFARSPSPYSSTAESWALANVRWAFASDRLIVLGSSLFLAVPCL